MKKRKYLPTTNGLLHIRVHLQNTRLSKQGCYCIIILNVHFSSNLYIALLSTYVYHIFDLCIQKDIQDTFHLRCDIGPPDISEDIVWNNSLRKTLVLGNLINVKSNKKTSKLILETICLF